MRNTKILFIGDSITEAGRFEDREEIGFGYVLNIRDYFAINQPENLPIIINKGVGGNRISDLEERWQEDVIDLNPDIVSISIGINDVWRQLDHPDKEQITPPKFNEIYRRILDKVKRETNAKIILMEPTIIEENVTAKGNLLLKQYVQIIHEVAESYHALVIPTHQVFINYLHKTNHQTLTTDGVHMNSTGNLLMAQTWLQTYENK
ncbi:SGNH/GDSL hydrolase family protein [Bacillus sp. B1-b2]|uniref:SGNH/GDSL hydrolase family protein n=1 Tax=Bacillus sp. B1-b2 TaxID=2653201 RepID=UPI0012621D0D|nr:SGNH/GDSL hydrolase family protein [Bacillus sp. B1-b2]KAB7666279.1 SGNH/GDSL hydrolase family protein [Bacillus sp. B1-b2]